VGTGREEYLLGKADGEVVELIRGRVWVGDLGGCER
jgi:hypothetical protein